MQSKAPLVTLVGEITEAIERGIREGRYLPGVQLVEQDLAAELGVSRVPIREALRRLAAQRIVEIKPYRGAFVRKLTRREALDVLDILQALGRLAVARAAERIDEGNNRKELQQFMARERPRTKRRHVVKEWIDINYPFYQTIARLSGNPAVPELIHQFQMQMYRLVADSQLSQALQESTLQRHAAIAQAILAGDPKQALHSYDSTVGDTRRALEVMPDTAFAPERD